MKCFRSTIEWNRAIIQIWQWMFMDRGCVTETEIVGYCLEQYLDGFGIWDIEDYSEPRLPS